MTAGIDSSRHLWPCPPGLSMLRKWTDGRRLNYLELCRNAWDIIIKTAYFWFHKGNQYLWQSLGRDGFIYLFKLFNLASLFKMRWTVCRFFLPLMSKSIFSLPLILSISEARPLSIPDVFEVPQDFLHPRHINSECMSSLSSALPKHDALAGPCGASGVKTEKGQQQKKSIEFVSEWNTKDSRTDEEKQGLFDGDPNLDVFPWGHKKSNSWFEIGGEKLR